MEYLADTHMHSIYSYDGQMCLEDMIKRGESLGLKYMAFTEHLELGQITIKQFLNRYKVYSTEVDKLQIRFPHIKLIKGVEFTNPEKYPKELEIVNGLDIDYIIGSNHELPESLSEREMLEYYQKILRIVKNGGIDSLGHMDYQERKRRTPTRQGIALQCTGQTHDLICIGIRNAPCRRHHRSASRPGITVMGYIPKRWSRRSEREQGGVGRTSSLSVYRSVHR